MLTPSFSLRNDIGFAKVFLSAARPAILLSLSMLYLEMQSCKKIKLEDISHENWKKV